MLTMPRFLPLPGRSLSVRLRVFLAAFMVPVVLVSGPGAAPASATNANPWKTHNLTTGRVLDQDITCRMVARYTADGLGVEWNKGTCINGVDIDPYMDTPPEEGVDYELTFRGVRTGQGTGVGWEVHGAWKKVGDGRCWVNGTLEPASIGGTGSSTQCRFYTPTRPNTDGINLGMIKKTTGGASVGGMYTAGATPRYVSRGIEPAPYYFQICSNGWVLPPGGQVARDEYCERNPVTGEVDIGYVMWMPGPTAEAPELPPPGQAGDACEASVDGKMGPSANQSLSSRAGSFAGGQATFPDSSGGTCQVNEICIGWHDPMGPFGDYDVEACETVDWEPPATEPGTEPESPAPPDLENDTPTADDEQSFWDSVLDLLMGLLRQIAKGLKAIVTAIVALGETIVDALAGIVDGILDGIQALFVPDGDAFDDALDEAKSGWQGGNAGAWTSTLTDAIDDPGAGSAQVITVGGFSGGSGCGGPTITWDRLSEAGLDPTIKPLDACGGLSSQLASWSRVILGAVVSVAGLFKIVQILMLSLGVTKPGQEVAA